MNPSPPTLTLAMAHGRDYEMLLCSTKTVYDQLLSDKFTKLQAALMNKKEQYDAKCAEIAKVNEAQAMEFGVRAQESLNRFNAEYAAEVTGLRADYQTKLNDMYEQLEEKWQAERHETLRRAAATGNTPLVNCKMYQHK